MNADITDLIRAADWLGERDLRSAFFDPRGIIAERGALLTHHMTRAAGTRGNSLAEGIGPDGLTPTVPSPALPAPFIVGRNSYHVSGELRAWTVIGRYCSLSRFVDVGLPLGAGPEAARNGTSQPKRPITVIGCDVWVGAHACILEGVLVGHGAVVGAHSVVAEDVPPYAVVGGNPAQLIRYRFPPDLVMRLLAAPWWTLPSAAVGRLPKADVEASLSIAEEYKRRP